MKELLAIFFFIAFGLTLLLALLMGIGIWRNWSWDRVMAFAISMSIFAVTSLALFVALLNEMNWTP